MRVIIAFSALMLLFTTGCLSQSGNGSKTVAPDEFNTLLQSKKDGILLDVRTPAEYSDGHLANATNIDFRDARFDDAIGKLDKNKPVLVYCLSGGRSSAASEKLVAAGFKEVYNLKGGITSWRASGKPVTAEGTV